MNSNLFRTIMTALGITSLGILPLFNYLTEKVFGCVADNPATDAVNDAICTGGIIDIPVEYRAYAALAFIAAGFLAKWFLGTGTTAENLAAPAVPVVPEEKAKVGVVTPKQVAATGSHK